MLPQSLDAQPFQLRKFLAGVLHARPERAHGIKAPFRLRICRFFCLLPVRKLLRHTIMHRQRLRIHHAVFHHPHRADTIHLHMFLLKNKNFCSLFLYHNGFVPAEQSPKNEKTALGTINGTKSRKLAFFAPEKSYTGYSEAEAR